MATIQGEITIARPVEEVFDLVADQTTEPRYNRAMVRAEKVTDGPVGVGTRFRSAVRSGRRTSEMTIKITGYERPRLLRSVTTMPEADINYTLTFEPVPEGTRLRWAGSVRPRGALRAAGPLVTWVGRRQERRTWASLRDHLEGRASSVEPDEERRGVMARTWKDLTPQQQRGVATLGAVQLALAVAAWVDLARRPAAQVNGPKGLWAAVIAVNWVGPIAWFVRGRRHR